MPQVWLETTSFGLCNYRRRDHPLHLLQLWAGVGGMTSHLSSAGSQEPERIATAIEQNKCSPQELRYRGMRFGCKRACCKPPKVVSKPQYHPIFINQRNCVMCKRKYYASGVQCMLGNFDCIPDR